MTNITLFSQIIQTLDRSGFDRLVNQHQSDKNKILLLDATTISLCLSLFDWAVFRKKKGAIELHTFLDFIITQFAVLDPPGDPNPEICLSQYQRNLVEF